MEGSLIARWFLLDKSGRSRNEAMEGLRGYASLIVFLAHICGCYAGSRMGIDLEQYPWGRSASSWVHVLHWGYRGDYGVEIFFILSGFLLVGMMRSRADSFKLGAYLWQRALRLWPVFLVTSAITIWLLTQYWCVEIYDVRRVLESATLLDGISAFHIHAYNPVSWSLSYELVLYLFCPLLLFWPRVLESPRYFGALAVVLIVLILGMPSMAMRGSLFLFGGWLATFRVEHLQRAARCLPDGLVVALYAVATLPYMIATPVNHWRSYSLFFAVGGTILVVRGCFGEGWLNRFLRCRALRLMGNISYSFYLIHLVCVRGVCMSAVGRAWQSSHPYGAFAACAVVAFLISFLCAVVLYLLLERGYFVPRCAVVSPWVGFYRRAVLPAGLIALLLLIVVVGWSERHDQRRATCVMTCCVTNHFSGVVVGGDARETGRDAALTLESTGRDPMMVLPAIPPTRGEHIFATFDLEVPCVAVMQLFYLTPEFPVYSELSSQRSVVRPGRHRFFLRFPVRVVQGAIRLDPMEVKGVARLYSFSLWATPMESSERGLTDPPARRSVW